MAVDLVRGPFADKGGAVFNVGAYGAVGDGVAVDRTAISNTIDAMLAHGNRHLHFPRGVYNLGDLSASELVFEFGAVDGLVITSPDALFVCNTTDDTTPTVFRFSDTQDIHLDGLRLRDDGYEPGTNWHGALFFVWASVAATETRRGFHAIRCKGESCVTSFTFTDAGGAARLSDINLIACGAADSHYGIVCQENGDNLHAPNFECRNLLRAYFAYGIEDHDVRIVHEVTDAVMPTSNALCIIKALGRDIRRIKLRVSVKGIGDRHQNIVALEHQPTPARVGIIRDIDLDIHAADDMTAAGALAPVVFRSYTVAGVLEDTTANKWDYISLRGKFGAALGGGQPIYIQSVQATEGVLAIDPSVHVQPTKLYPHYPGFVVKLAADREVRTFQGNVTTAAPVFTIPLGELDGNAFILSILHYVHNGALGPQNAILRKDTLIGYNAAGGDVVIQSEQNVFSHVLTAGVLFTYTVNGENIDVTMAGAAYNNDNCFARMEVQYPGRGPWRA